MVVIVAMVVLIVLLVLVSSGSVYKGVIIVVGMKRRHCYYCFRYYNTPTNDYGGMLESSNATLQISAYSDNIYV